MAAEWVATLHGGHGSFEHIMLKIKCKCITTLALILLEPPRVQDLQQGV